MLLIGVPLVLGCARGVPPPAPDGGPSDGGCIGADFLTALGKSSILVGASMADSSAAAADWDVRYQYLAGGLFDQGAPCASCAASCSSAGHSCANSAGGCGWWGCYQYDQLPPGLYARDFVSNALGRNEIAMFTYYEILQASGVIEGPAEVTQAANDRSLMSRYLADFRFLMQQVGTRAALVQVEPDFWGYAQHVNQNPHAIPAAVASADPTDCTGLEDTIAGLGRCFIRIARKYAPSVRIGLHGSSWGPGIDATSNTDSSVDVAAEGRKLAAFLLACGAGDGDFVTVDASDRDAGYYQSIGRQTFWDANNVKLPHFHQAFAWAAALAESVGKPILWWQVPVGNMSQANTADHWQDNRVDYFFSHTAELAAAHSAGMFFGAGATGQTTPESDGGNLIARAKTYLAAGGQRFGQ
jgi:hypothetical protein